MYVESVLAPPIDCVEKADSLGKVFCFSIAWFWSHGWSQVKPAILGSMSDIVRALKKLCL